MKGFQVATLESFANENDIFATTTGNFNIIWLEHLMKIKCDDVVKNNENDMADLEGSEGVKRENFKDPIVRLMEEANEEAASDGLGGSAPEANACEFQSHGVIEMLEKLLDKFIDERTTLEKDEMNARHTFEKLTQDLTALLCRPRASSGKQEAFALRMSLSTLSTIS